jgi:hypothetical protein
MTCAGISVVKNESDIIEIFIRHNLKFLDKLYIVDHISQDNTLDILSKLKTEGYNLEISTNTSPRHIQAEVFNEIIRKINTDFITFIDADEFLISDNFKESLINLPDDRVSFINWHNYLPQNSDDKNELNVLKRIKNKLVPIDTNQHKALIPNKIYSNPKSYVQLGGHEIYYKDGGEITPAPYAIITSVHLAHFPARSLEQIQKKAFVNWLAKLANPLHQSGRLKEGKIPNWHHWKILFDLLKNDPSITEEKVMNAVRDVYMKNKSVELIHVPIDNDDTIKYEIKSLTPLALLAGAAEQQAVFLQKTNQLILNLTKELGNFNI